MNNYLKEKDIKNIEARQSLDFKNQYMIKGKGLCIVRSCLFCHEIKELRVTKVRCVGDKFSGLCGPCYRQKENKNWEPWVLFRRTRDQASKNGHKWDISKKDYYNIIKQECFYCGTPPSNEYKRNQNTVYYYNGLDRIDSFRGYILSNIVPCCYICNKIKSDLNVEDWLDHIEKINDYKQKILQLLFDGGA